MIPITVTYSTSLGKWHGIKRFAEANDIDTSKIDAMIARIETRGDVLLDKVATFEISNMGEFIDSIFSTKDHPCPHCAVYSCSECPLDDDSPACCKEWDAVKKQLLYHL